MPAYESPSTDNPQAVPIGALVVLVFWLLGIPALGQERDAKQAKRIEELIEQLGDDDSDVWCLAIRKLRDNGSEAVPALITALSDENEDVPSRAAEALSEIGAPGVPALITALTSESEAVRYWAVDVLCKIEPTPVSIVPSLAAVLSDDESVAVRQRAAEALMAQPGAPAVLALIAALSDTKVEVQFSAMEALRWNAEFLDRDGDLWWIVPRVYWKELLALFLVLAAWFALAARFPRHRPASMTKHVALITLTATVPMTLSRCAIYYASAGWARLFLPDAVAMVPFDVVVVLSVAFLCALPAAWVCQRKSLAPEVGQSPMPSVEPGPGTTP